MSRTIPKVPTHDLPRLETHLQRPTTSTPKDSRTINTQPPLHNPPSYKYNPNPSPPTPTAEPAPTDFLPLHPSPQALTHIAQLSLADPILPSQTSHSPPPTNHTIPSHNPHRSSSHRPATKKTRCDITRTMTFLRDQLASPHLPRCIPLADILFQSRVWLKSQIQTLKLEIHPTNIQTSLKPIALL